MRNNQLIIENREAGKTTYLFDEINRSVSQGFGIILLDSVTQHEDKSLLKKVTKEYDNTVTIDVQNENKVVLGKMPVDDFIKNFMNHFPFSDVIKNKEKIICFDLSYFLEKGHAAFENYNDRDLYEYYRNLYNNLSLQIALSLILMEKYDIIKNKLIVMDEIEFPVTNYNISQLQQNLNFIASIHPENAFGTFYESFDRIEFQVYRKRKD